MVGVGTVGVRVEKRKRKRGFCGLKIDD